MYKYFNFLTSLPIILFSIYFLIMVILMGMRWYLMIFTCICLMIMRLNIFFCACWPFVYLLKCLSLQRGKSSSLLNSLEVTLAGGRGTATMAVCLWVCTSAQNWQSEYRFWYLEDRVSIAHLALTSYVKAAVGMCVWLPATGLGVGSW